MADTSIPETALTAILEAVDKGNLRVARHFPGDPPGRQPVHTVYGGAQRFTAGTANKLGALALQSLQQHAPDPASLAAAVDIAPALAERVYLGVIDKLTREPVEDFRIDFEDGFGLRSDDEEDRAASEAAGQMAAGLDAGTLPPFVGIRIKALDGPHKRRALRTFDLFLTRLLDRTGGRLPPNFVVTLPKVTSPEQVAALASACDAFEYWRELTPGSLRCELMIETPQAVVSPDGGVALPRLLAEAPGRLVACHFGAYDYTAACGIAASHQHLRHPAGDFARRLTQVALAGTGLWLSDGATNVLPVGDRESVRRGWRVHAAHVRQALADGIYQGWDLHPAQLPSRYAAVYAFFLEGIGDAAARLRHFIDRSAQATLSGSVFDDAATGQALLNFFLRALTCGAIGEREALELTGLKAEELRHRSLAQLIENRRTGR